MFCVLGPVGVVVDGQAHVLGSTREAGLLADLLVHANQVVSGDRLIEDLWRGQPSPGAGATLHTYVKNVRRLLEPGRATGTRSDILVTRRRGYLLRVEADELDAWRAARLIADGRATLVEGDAEAAEARFTDALTLWRGPSFGDLADEPYLQSEATRLDELRLSAIEERVQARISLGRHGELCAEIEALVGEHPFRERLWEQWMLTLYRSGRQADALRAYRARPPAAGRRAGHRAWRLPSPPRGGDPRPRSRARLGSRAVGLPTQSGKHWT